MKNVKGCNIHLTLNALGFVMLVSQFSPFVFQNEIEAEL